MNEKEMESWLGEAITSLEDEENEVRRVGTYEEEGILTRNKGLVVRFKNGDEFQICIVQSKGDDEVFDDEEIDEADKANKEGPR